ncbi:hypothetical protein R84981_001162 [Carnimonas sp. R-84981]|uniref:hypothetical protein n=1 Tax=Carnimonas bestiolae TaxID=3402172 RepID=UPI003EDBD831
MTRILLPLAFLAIAGCSTAPHHAEPQHPQQQLEAAAYAYLIEHNSSSLKRGAAAFCLAVSDENAATNTLRDPSAATLFGVAQRFSGKVLVQSACHLSSVQTGARARTQQHRDALYIEAGNFQCTSATRCTFKGGYYEANASASHGEYRAIKQGDQWHIEPVGPIATS